MSRIKESLVVKANHSERTFTISKYIDGKLFATYKTIRMGKTEFYENENMTENDWKYFLRSTNDYFVK